RGVSVVFARDVVGQEDPVSVVVLLRHVVVLRNIYIIALLCVVLNYSWPVNMSSRRRERVMEACSVRSPHGQGLGQGAPPRSILSGREEAGVPEPRCDQALPNRPAVWPVSRRRCRG